jgi:diacylglycerol kinase family enzyme
VIPSGTLNHFARDAGIPVDLNQAVAILARHRIGYVDVGVVNDQIFINNASIGGYPQMVQERVRLERLGRRRRFASIAAVARTWWQLRSLTARLSVDGTEIIRHSPFIVVGNGSYVVSGLDTLEAEEQFEVFRAFTITVDVSPPRLRVAIDGEVIVLATPLRFSIRSNALRVLMPLPEDLR